MKFFTLFSLIKDSVEFEDKHDPISRCSVIAKLVIYLTSFPTEN